MERFRPANAPKGAVEKIILDIPFSYRDVAARAGVRWDPEIKACFFEKRPGQALPLELEGFEPKQLSWEEKIQRELNGGAFSTVLAQKSTTLRPHQLEAIEAIFSAYKNGYPGFLLADDVGLGKPFAAWAGILKIIESSREKWKILIVCPLGVVANWRSSGCPGWWHLTIYPEQLAHSAPAAKDHRFRRCARRRGPSRSSSGVITF